jgi:hypothetical protein
MQRQDTLVRRNVAWREYGVRVRCGGDGKENEQRQNRKADKHKYRQCSTARRPRRVGYHNVLEKGDSGDSRVEVELVRRRSKTSGRRKAPNTRRDD